MLMRLRRGRVQAAGEAGEAACFPVLILRSAPRARLEGCGLPKILPSFETPASQAPQGEDRVQMITLPNPRGNRVNAFCAPIPPLDGEGGAPKSVACDGRLKTPFGATGGVKIFVLLPPPGGLRPPTSPR